MGQNQLYFFFECTGCLVSFFVFNPILDVQKSATLTSNLYLTRETFSDIENRVKYQKINSLLRKLGPFGFIFCVFTHPIFFNFVTLCVMGKNQLYICFRLYVAFGFVFGV